MLAERVVTVVPIRQNKLQPIKSKHARAQGPTASASGPGQRASVILPSFTFRALTGEEAYTVHLDLAGGALSASEGASDISTAMFLQVAGRTLNGMILNTNGD